MYVLNCAEVQRGVVGQDCTVGVLRSRVGVSTHEKTAQLNVPHILRAFYYISFISQLAP